MEEVDRFGSSAVMRRFRLPEFYWKLERFLNYGPERELARVMNDVRAWFGGIIDQSLRSARERVERREASNAVDDENAIKSVVELFVESSQSDLEGLRAEDLVDFLLTFVLAAQDTSALTLAWFFYAINKYPVVEKRIRDEMEEILPGLGVKNDTYLTTEHISKLVYFEATMRETLRLYTTVPLMQKVAEKDTVVCGDIPVRAGESVIMSMYAMARNPHVWGPDAGEFKPERWIDQANSELLSFPASKFAAFSAGPRICIGMKLGMLEIRVVAANLMRRYKLELQPPSNGSYLVGITLSHKQPLHMKVTHSA